MKNGSLADFFFIGLGVVPALLMLNGRPAMAILLFPPLLIAACLCGANEREQDIAGNERQAGAKKSSRDSVPQRAPDAGASHDQSGR